MPAIILVLALAGFVWGIVYLTRGSLLLGALVFVLTGACLGHAFFHQSLGAVPITLDRLVLLAVVLAFLVQQRLGKTEPKPWGRADLALLLLVVVLALSGTVSGWTGHIGASAPPVWRFLGGYIIPLLVYWVARQSPLDGRQLSAVHGVLTLVGVYLGFTGLAEVTRQWWAVWPGHIADATVGLHFGRARGPMVHAVSYGLYLGVCLLACWAWSRRFGRPLQLLLGLATVVMVAGLYFCYTRSVWMGVALALLVTLTLTLPRAWRPLVLGGVMAGAAVLLATRMDNLLSLQREGSRADTRQSVDMRGSFTYVSWLMFQDHPLLGVGFGHFPEAKLPYLADRATALRLDPIRPYVHHNTYLSLLTETGLVGLGLFLTVLACWGRAAWRVARSGPEWARQHGVLMLGVLAIYACQLMFHELTYTPIDNSLVFFLAGMTVGLDRRRPPATVTAPSPAPALAYPAAASS